MTFLAVVYALLEGALVNYVVPDSLTVTTHSHDVALTRLCRWRWYSYVCAIFWYSFGHKSHTDTRVREVVVRQSMCGVPVRTWIRHNSVIENFDGCWENKTCESSSPPIIPWYRVIFGWLFLHDYTCDGGGCKTEYVWRRCEDSCFRNTSMIPTVCHKLRA